MKTKLFSKDFILVVIGQIISLFGNGILRFALPLYLLRQTGSPAIFGAVSACSFLPVILLSFLGGVLADRVNKRNIMVALDFLTAAIVLVLTLVLEIVPIIPLFIVAMMILYGISGTYQPAVQASIPALVVSDKVMTATAIVNQIASLAGLLGPVIGGMLFGAFGIYPILIISVGCFAVSAIMEIFIKIPYTKREGGQGIFEIIKTDFKDSMGYIRHEKPHFLKIGLVVVLFNMLISAMLIIATPVLIVETLKLSDELLGITQGALALGGLVGGIMAAVVGKKLKLSNAYISLLLSALSIGVMAIPLMLGLSPMICYVAITVASFLVMATATLFTVQVISIVQIETPQELVGKVIAVLISISMCSQPIGQLLYGFIFDTINSGEGYILLAVALISAVISLSSKKVFKEA